MAESSAAIRTFRSDDSLNAEELFSKERKIRDVSALNVDFTPQVTYILTAEMLLAKQKSYKVPVLGLT